MSLVSQESVWMDAVTALVIPRCNLLLPSWDAIDEF